MRKTPRPHDKERWPHRLPAACAAAALLWCVRAYCTGEAGDGLFWTTALLAAVAVVLPRPLAATSRWTIWAAVVLTVVCMAANVERLTPAKGDYFQLYLLDRLVTVCFAALGVGALFFRLGTGGVTRILLGTLPMAMLVLARPAPGREAAPPPPPAFLWVLFGLIGLLELARQGAAHRAGGATRLGWREWLPRGGWMAAALAAACLLAPPVEQAAFALQRQLLELNLRSPRHREWRRDTELALFRALPRGFGQRTRLLFTVEAATAPGYLRESVFTTYLRGRWLAPEGGAPLDPADTRPGTGAGMTRYALRPSELRLGLERLRVDVFAPRLLTGLCLPGTAVTLHGPAAEEPYANSNGMVHVEGGALARYAVDASPADAGESAYPLPDGFSNPAYLQVPASLAVAVSNWIEQCRGLTAARSAAAAAACIESDFADRFAYQETIRLPVQPDPLVNFMVARAGYCVHFASAAALMLRARGIPARVVGGYVCREWAPWLKRWVVRERQGHAWVEAWDAAAGTWFLVEATPAAGRPDPRREVGLARNLKDLVLSLWRNLRALVEEANLLQAVADTGVAVAQWVLGRLRTPWGLLLPALLLALAARRARRRRVPEPEVAVRRALTRAAEMFVRRRVPGHLQRRVWESWDGWLVRIGSELPEARRGELVRWIEEYQQLRYRGTLNLAEARRWIAAARRARRR